MKKYENKIAKFLLEKNIIPIINDIMGIRR